MQPGDHGVVLLSITIYIRMKNKSMAVVMGGGVGDAATIILLLLDTRTLAHSEPSS